MVAHFCLLGGEGGFLHLKATDSLVASVLYCSTIKLVTTVPSSECPLSSDTEFIRKKMASQPMSALPEKCQPI